MTDTTRLIDRPTTENVEAYIHDALALAFPPKAFAQLPEPKRNSLIQQFRAYMKHFGYDIIPLESDA